MRIWLVYAIYWFKIVKINYLTIAFLVLQIIFWPTITHFVSIKTTTLHFVNIMTKTLSLALFVRAIYRNIKINALLYKMIRFKTVKFMTNPLCFVWNVKLDTQIYLYSVSKSAFYKVHAFNVMPVIFRIAVSVNLAFI